MASIQKAQTGARVYRGVGQSPNTGQVSAKGAQGYLAREQRNNTPVRPVGNDGKSDSRSGVAKAALSRQTGTKLKPLSNQPKQPAAKATSAPKSVASTQPRAAAVLPPAQVRVNNTGVLEIPYDQSYSADQYAAVGQANQDLIALQGEEQQNDLDYASATNQANLAAESLSKMTRSGAGGSGTLFSSQYGNQVATNSLNYSNEIAGLTSKNAQFKTNAAERRAAINSNLNQQLQAMTQSYTDSLADDAGDLGYDTSTYEDASDSGPSPVAASNAVAVQRQQAAQQSAAKQKAAQAEKERQAEKKRQDEKNKNKNNNPPKKKGK